ncbi:MAG: Dyp-type peroxidase [Natronomonas sp.]
MDIPGSESLSRREYLRAAVAVGGAAGLSACLDTVGETAVPRGDPADRPERQHGWNAVLSTDDDGNHVPPEHRVLLPLRLTTEPDKDDSHRVESAFRTLEQAYEYSPDGLLFSVGYSPSYFGRIGGESPIPEPEALTSMESPDFDDFDAIVHLASDSPEVVLEAEEALLGNADPNGLEPDATLSGVFERAEPRRTGFVGDGLPAQHTDVDGVPDSVPEEAPFFMGFRSGFSGSQAPEDRVTIQDGPFAGGTTLHVSTMDLNLRQWFEQDNHFQRVAKMFSPEHADDGVGEIGEELGAATGASAVADDTEEHARTRGMVGHAQKAARARDEDGTPPLLRRDFNTIDETVGEGPGVHFVAYQRTIDDFVRVREAMTGADLTGGGVGQRLNNGILQYILVHRRGNFIVPPRSKRALPGV